MESKIQIARITTDLISVADAKTHLLVEHSDDDTKIQQFIDAAIIHTENVCRRTLPLTEYMVAADSFGDEIKIVAPPPRGIGAVTYHDGTTRQTLSTDDYQVDTDWNTLSITPVDSFPSGDEIRFSMISGYGTYAGYVGYTQVYPLAFEGETIPDLAVPVELIQAIHMLIGVWYENREAISPLALNRVPMGYDSLVMRHRAYRI